MNGSLQKLSKSAQVILALLVIVVAIATCPARIFAIDGQRLQAANQDQPSLRERQLAARNRSGQKLVHPHPFSRWTLGVQVADLQTGTRITHVSPSSAAWRVGLEKRDVIVSVNGYQVGFVNRDLYDLESELNLRADRNGSVRLLVWNHRNGELVNVDVALDRSRPPRPVPKKGGINGTVTFRSSLTAEANAEVVVQLVDITDRLKGGKLIVEDRIPFSGQVPVSFHLDIDPAQLDTHRRYQLQANLSVNGRRVLASQPGLYLLNQVDVRAVEIDLKPIRFDKR